MVTAGNSGAAARKFKARLVKEGWATTDDFQLKPGFLYTVVRAISARVNQNYDGWPSEELKKSYKTFLHKPVFVNHENHDPTKARGVVVAARYVENGMDKYIEVVQEIDAGRFPKLAHEIKTGGLDSVSMGAEAGFTICSYCHNRATDLDDMCEHVRNHKGKTLSRFDRRTGSKEDVLVFESCHKISFFELSYVFEPADETAVASKVVVAGLNKQAVDFRHDPRREGESEEEWFNRLIQPSPGEHGKPLSEPRPEPPKAWDYTHHEHMPWLQPDGFSWHPHFVDWYSDTFGKHPDRAGSEGKGSLMDSQGWNGATIPGAAEQYVKHLQAGGEPWNPDEDLFDPRQFGAGKHTAADDLAIPAPPGTKTTPQSVIDNTPVFNLAPATQLTGHEAPGVPKQGFAADIAEITKMAIHRHAGDCPPGMDCSRNMGAANGLEQIGKDTPNNPVNQVSYDPASLGQPGSAGGGGGSPDADNILPGSRALYDQLLEEHPGAEIGGYRVDSYGEHARGALDFMTTDDAQAAKVREKAFASGAPYVIWKQQQWNADGSVSAMEDRGDPTQNHFDHVHIAPLPATPPPTPAATEQPKSTGVQPTTRAAGKYTKEDFANAGGKKPWETDTAATPRNPVEDDDLREIEAMLRTADDTPSDDYWEWKAQHGEDADAEHDVPPARGNPNLQRWVEEISRRHLHAAEINPLNSRNTQRDNTIGTYRKVHDFFDAVGAPCENGTEGVLDYGAGKGHSSEWGHTYEPHPQEGEDGVRVFEPTYLTSDQVPSGRFHRVTNIHVLNVVPPKVRHGIVRGIGDALAAGGHAVIVTRSKHDVDSTANKVSADAETGDSGGYRVNPDTSRETYQKGFTPDELHHYVSSQLGPGYTVVKIPGKHRLSAPAVHVIKNAEAAPSRRKVRSAALRKIARNRAVKLAWGEQEAPMAVDTLREEGSAPEDDNNDFERYVDPPKDLQTPDLSQAAQIDRQQELQGAGPDQMGGVPGAAEGGPQQDQGQYITLKIPMPNSAPQVPPQAAPPVMAQPPAMPPAADPTAAGQPPMQIAASVLDYFDGYYGRRIANWLDAIEASRAFTPEEAADYRRQAAQLSTLQNGRGLSTTGRNPQKGTANMARRNIASRTKVATAGRRQHFAEGPLVDGGDRSRNDQGEQEEAFISQTPPFVEVDFPDDDTPNISNTEHNLVAKVQQGRAQLLRDAQALANVRQRRAFDEAGGPTAEIVDPRVLDSESEKLTGDDFISADPNDGVVPTNPKDASLRAFQAFDGWLAQKTGKSSRRHSEATIKKAAAAFSREAGISPQALFPALGIVLREARKSDKKANTKGAKMRKRADEKLEVAAPDGRIDVEAPVSDTTDAEAQASQFDLHDFGNNAGDNIAKPDLSTDQNWAPGEASKTSARVKTAGGLLAMRCAEGMIAAGLEPNSRERKYQLAAEFEQMNRGLIQDRVALLERFAAVRQADLRKVASGSSRGAARSPIPAGLGGGTRTAAAPQRLAAHDPRNDSSLFI